MFYAVDDYLALPRPETPFLIQDLVNHQGKVLMYGPPKVGKSFLALQLANGIGDPDVEDVLGKPVMTHGNVCYLQVDTPRPDWADRVETMKKLGFTFKNVFFADRQSGVPVPFNILNPDTRLYLQHQVREKQPLLIVVDILRRTFPGNENDSDVIAAVLNAFEDATDFRKGPGTAIMFLTHQKKDQNTGVPKVHNVVEDCRGSSNITGSVDIIIACRRGEIAYVGRNSEQDCSIYAEQSKELKGIWTLSADGLKKEQIFMEVLQDERIKTLKEKGKLIQDRLEKELNDTAPPSIDAISRELTRLRKKLGL